MTSTHNSHDQDTCLKRKRVAEDSLDDRQHKRNFTELPIRMSHQDLQLQNFFQGPLTPVDSSDDEAHGQAESTWFRKRTKSVNEHHRDEEMDLGTNVVSKPLRQINLFASAMSFRDRAPTPITATFGNKSGVRQFSRPTILSPFMAEEPYLPSPVESVPTATMDPETTIRMEHASSGFGALSVTCQDDDMMEDSAIEIATPPTQSKAKHSTKGAKLHMGFRADCEKCQQRVPGHYSHIVWS